MARRLHIHAAAAAAVPAVAVAMAAALIAAAPAPAVAGLSAPGARATRPAAPAAVRDISAASTAPAAPVVASPAPLDGPLPVRWDWRELGMVTPARGMGNCDACWCFAAVGAIESAVMIAEGRALDLAEQQVLACADPDRGCDGGWMDDAYRYARDHGLALESCFPYVALDNVACQDHDCPPAAVIAGWVDVPSDEASLKAALLQGPVSTAMVAPTDFFGYDGSYCLGGRPPTNYVTAVLIVGWDDELCDGGAWICKGNYGPLWGEEGFFTVRRGVYEIGWHAQRPLYEAGQQPQARLDLLFDGLGGDGDSWPEPGETVQLFLQVRNGLLAPPLPGLRVDVSLAGGPAAAPAAAYVLGPLATGELADLQPLFALTIDRAAAPGDTLELAFAFAAGGAPAGADTLAVAIGRPTVLLVDDDEGEDLQAWFAGAIARTGHPFRVWEDRRAGPPSAAELQRYRAVVWETGVFGRLETENISAMANLLVGGGRLFLTGEDIGYQLVEIGDPLDRQFYRDYLEAVYLADDSGARAVTGVPGEPLSEGLAFTLGGPGGSGRQDYPSLIAPAGGAASAFLYGPGQTAGVRSTTFGRLLYLAFGFEAIDQAAQRDSVMTRALHWLAGPAPDVTPPRVVLLAPLGDEAYPTGSTQTVRWRARDDRGVIATLVELSRDGGATWPQLLGAPPPGDSTLAWAVGDSTGAALRIRVSARDLAGLWGEASSGDFRVGEPEPPPALPSLTLLGAAPNPAAGLAVLRFQTGRAVAQARVRILDLRGRLVRTLVTGPLDAGQPVALEFDGRDDGRRLLPAGLYAWSVEVPGASAAGRLVLLR